MSAQCVEGSCHPDWQPVREAFAAMLREAGPQGCALALAVDGELVLDLWSGAADRAGERPWQRDTVVNAFSAGKGVLAMAIHQLADAGELDLERPVAHYWPEFAAGGKRRIALAQVLDHTAGLVAFGSDIPPGEVHQWDAMTAYCARELPRWEPGSALGYSPFLYGWILGEVLRRVTGMMPGDYYRRELCGPLGADFLLGLTEAELPRAADMGPWQHPEARPEGPTLLDLSRESGLTRAAFTQPSSLMAGTNSAAWRQAQIPAAGGHAGARALAILYGALAAGGRWGGRRLMGEGAIRRAAAERASGQCAVLHAPLSVGLGFMRSGGALALPEGAFGHPGAGGALGFADPARRMGFGFVSNRLGQHLLLDPRAQKLLTAIARCAAGPSSGC